MILHYIWRLLNAYVTYFEKSAKKLKKQYKYNKHNEFLKELFMFIGALLGGILVIFAIAIIIVKVYEFIIAPKSLLMGIVVYMTIAAIIAGILSRFVQVSPNPIAPSDDDYIRLRRSLYQALSNTASVMGLAIPTYDGELSPPERTFHYMRGNVPIHQYFCLKTVDAINKHKIKTILQKRFEQMESNLELPTANPKGYLFQGRYFCSILVMDVKDSGGFVEIDLAFASDSACRQWLSSGKSASITITNKDSDF